MLEATDESRTTARLRAARRSLVMAGCWLLVAMPATARGFDVVAPADGAVVSSLPQFQFDFPEGSAEIELSLHADVKTDGGFVEPLASELFFFGGSDGPDHLGQWDGPRINAGRYYWSATLNDYSGNPDHRDRRTAVRSFTVADEAIVFQGWSLRARRVAEDCPHSRYGYEITGALAFDDNSAEGRARYDLEFQGGGRTVRVTGRVTETSPSFTGTVCPSDESATVIPHLEDSTGHITTGPSRSLTFPGFVAQTSRQDVRIRRLYAAWMADLRRGRGAPACRRMTPAFRSSLRRISELPRSRWSCPEIIELAGRELAREIGRAPLVVEVRGRRATGRFRRAGGGFFFLRGADGRWRLHIPPRAERRRYPGVRP